MQAHKRKRNGRRLRLAVVAVLTAACQSEASPEGHQERLIAPDVILTVVNRTKSPARVVVESASLRHALGSVAVGATTSFSLPIALVHAPSPLYLEATSGTGTIRSDSFEIQRGERVVWTLGDTGRGTIARQ